MRFGGFHAFGYNDLNEIWRTLSRLSEAGPGRFWERFAQLRQLKSQVNFLSTHDFTDFLSAKFHKIWTQHVDRCRDENFRNIISKVLPYDVVYPKKRKNFSKFLTSYNSRHDSAMITDRRKFTTKIALHGISSFHFYRWNQFKVWPGLYTPYKKPPHIFLRRPTRVDNNTVGNADITQSQAANHHRLLSYVTRPGQCRK